MHPDEASSLEKEKKKWVISTMGERNIEKKHGLEGKRERKKLGEKFTGLD